MESGRGQSGGLEGMRVPSVSLVPFSEGSGYKRWWQLFVSGLRDVAELDGVVSAVCRNVVGKLSSSSRTSRSNHWAQVSFRAGVGRKIFQTSDGWYESERSWATSRQVVKWGVVW